MTQDHGIAHSYICHTYQFVIRYEIDPNADTSLGITAQFIRVVTERVVILVLCSQNNNNKTSLINNRLY